MGGEDENLVTSLAHLVLCCVGGNSIRYVTENLKKCYTYPGMHANLFLHGIIGFIHYQQKIFGDISPVFRISYLAARYLPLASLNADAWHDKPPIAIAHIASGVLPFLIGAFGKSEEAHKIGFLSIGANLVSLCFTSIQRNNDYGVLTAVAGAVAYLVAPTLGHKVFYPLSLGLMQHLSFMAFHKFFGVSTGR